MQAMKTQFDTGPLSWVKREIEFALDRADAGLDELRKKPNEYDAINSILPHIHQVSGVLLMVGLEPIGRIPAALEKLVEMLGNGDLTASDDIISTARAAIKALVRYLAGLMRGEPNRPLTLFPAYRSLLAAAGVDNASEVDLFYPDLTRSPSFSDTATVKRGAEWAALATLKRVEFQKGLLHLLRNSQVPQNLIVMRDALANVEAVTSEDKRLFWWIAVVFVDVLTTSSTPPSVLQKQLCGRIDLQIKQQIEGSNTAPERLIRELLLGIAQLPPNSQRIHEIQGTYHLITLLPPAAQESPETTRVKLFLRDLKDQLENIKEAWLRFTAGKETSPEEYIAQASQLNKFARCFNNKSLQALFVKLVEVGNDLTQHPRIPDEALAMETATALLVARDAIDNYPQLGPNFKRLAETMTVRVTAALRGRPLPDNGPHRPTDTSWAAREKQLFFHIGQEILSNLHHIEEVLDGFFRDPAKRNDLTKLLGSINQVHGALAMLESEEAVSLLKESRHLIEKLSIGRGDPDPDDAELLADALSNLGLFVSALQQGRENPSELLHGALARFNISPHPLLIPPQPILAELENPERK